MSLPIYQRVAVTDSGDVIPGAEYTVINENTGVAAPIYSDRTGATLLTAPYFADSAGTIQFFIAQGTTFRVAASGGVGTYTDRYVYGVAEAVLVQADGNVGIGTSSPDELLSLDSGNIKLTNNESGESKIYFTHSPSADRRAYIGALETDGNGNSLIFASNANGTDGVERVRIDSSGNVGIGTSSPAYELDVNGQINIADGKNIRCEGHILIGKSTDDEIRVGSGNTTDILKLFAGGSERMRIGLDGNVGIGTSSPSQKLDVNGSIYTDSQYLGGFGAKSTTGSLDWNDVTNARSGSGYTLLKGDAANGPGDNAYFHTFSYEYNSKDGSGNMAQLAFGYNTNKQYQRIKFSGTWSSWGTVL